MRLGSVWMAGAAAVLVAGAIPAGAGTLGLSPLTAGGLPLSSLANPEGKVNVSGIAPVELAGRRFLAVVVDEGTELCLVEFQGGKPGKAHVFDVVEMLNEGADLGKTDEVDLEGVAFQDGVLYAMGSCTLKRSKPKGKTREENLARLAEVIPVSGGKPGKWDEHSNFLIAMDASLQGGKPVLAARQAWSMRKRLGKDPLLARSLNLPSKEGGLDVEGYAVKGTRHWIGLRGPVLRGHAVVVRFEQAGRDLDGRHLSFLALEGMGIRDMAWMDHPRWGEGLFLLTGLTGEGSAPFGLWKWDGESDAFMDPGPGLEKIGEIVAPEGKAEAIFPCGEDLCVGFDGPDGGAPHRIRSGSR